MYQPTLGRFTSRDPLDDGGVDILHDNNWFGQRLDAMREHPYAYARGNPVNYTDPSGFGVNQDLRSCKYYKFHCKTASWWNLCQKAYYCLAADFVCEMAGNGSWRDCVRACLQCRDTRFPHGPENSNPVFAIIFGCIVHIGKEAIDHVVCFGACRWDTSSYAKGCDEVVSSCSPPRDALAVRIETPVSPRA